MTDRRAGFSLVELLFVLIIAAVLIGLVIPSLGEIQARRAAGNARDAFVFMANRARAEALQRGQTVTLQLDVSDESATLVVGTDTIARPIDFAAEYGAAVSVSGSGDLEICYLPRGFADPSCPSTQRVATFTTSGESAGATVRVLGQVESN